MHALDTTVAIAAQIRLVLPSQPEMTDLRDEQ